MLRTPALACAIVCLLGHGMTAAWLLAAREPTSPAVAPLIGPAEARALFDERMTPQVAGAARRQGLDSHRLPSAWFLYTAAREEGTLPPRPPDGAPPADVHRYVRDALLRQIEATGQNRRRRNLPPVPVAPGTPEITGDGT